MDKCPTQRETPPHNSCNRRWGEKILYVRAVGTPVKNANSFFWWRHHYPSMSTLSLLRLLFFFRRQERELNFPRFGRMGLGSRVYLIICPDLVGVQWQVARIYLRERRIKVRDINSVQRSVLLIHIIILDQGLRILVGSVMYRLGGHSYKFRLRLI